MNNVLRVMTKGLACLCVATVIAQATALTAMWLKGALDRPRLYRVLAALHGIDILTVHAQLLARQEPADTEQVSYTARWEADTRKSLDLDLRETAISKGLLELGSLQTALQSDQSRLRELKQAYDARLKELLDEEQTASRRELQRTLEAIRPDQAKQQIVKMMEDDAMDDVVAIMKTMPIDKRKKIIAEFKQREDEERLFEILKNIRTGEPTATQIQDARDRLAEIGPGPPAFQEPVP
jgi:hypothetical protein